MNFIITKSNPQHPVAMLNFDPSPTAGQPGKRPRDISGLHELPVLDSGNLNGSFSTLRVRPGIWVSLFDAAPERDIVFHFKKSARLFDFGFFLNGAFHNTIRSRSGRSEEMHNRTGQCGTGFLPESEGTVEISGGTHTRFLHIHMEKEVLKDLLREDMDLVPKDIRHAVEKDATTGFLRRDAMTPPVLSAARHLLCGLQTAMPWRMYLEGKVLELASLQLCIPDMRERDPGSGPLLSPSDRERIHAAGEALVADLVTPPNLTELAERFHMSVNKLQFGFREIFGTTVFGHLKEHKMQHAKMLFDQAEMNVSEVAWDVGYINLSHFSAAFKKRFGVLPKQYLHSVRSGNAIPVAV